VNAIGEEAEARKGLPRALEATAAGLGLAALSPLLLAAADALLAEEHGSRRGRGDQAGRHEEDGRGDGQPDAGEGGFDGAREAGFSLCADCVHKSSG
jgi:hypothetical protein